MCSIRYVLLPTHKKANVYACAFAEQKVLKVVREGKVRTPDPNETVKKKQKTKTEIMNFVTK